MPYVTINNSLISNSKSFLALVMAVGLLALPCQAESATFSGDYLSGQFARNNGDMDAATQRLGRVLKNEPDNADIAQQLEAILLFQGDIDKAIAMAEAKPLEKDQLTDLLLALKEIKNHHPVAAADILSASPAGNGSVPQLWRPLLVSWLDLANHKLAKPVTIESLSADVSRARPLMSYHLALINAQAGFIDAATANFKNAIEDPRTPSMRVMRMLIAFYEKNGQPPALKPLVAAYRDAHPDADDQSPASPIATVQDGVAEVLFTMGGIMLGGGVSNDAAVYLQLALYMKPDFPEAQLALGDAFADLQQYAKANDAYTRIASSHAFYRSAQLHIALNDERMGKVSDGLALLDRMAKDAPNDPDALITKGDLQRAHMRYAEAIDSYSQAIRRIPELKSQHWPLLFARGSCYERLGKWTQAENDLRQALKLKPDQPDVLNYLAYGWLERGEYMPEARSMLEKAVKARPDDAQIADSMGWVLYLSGDYEQAAHYLEKAVELLPADPTVNDHLGDAYWRLGHKTEARYQWERSLNSSQETRLADSLQRKLKEGLPPTQLAHTLTPVADSKPVNSAPATP